MRDDLALIELASASDVGRVRSDNQDSDLLAPPLMAVADGMGGHKGGGIASHMAVEALRAVGDSGDPAKLLGALKQANTTIAAAAEADPRTRRHGNNGHSRHRGRWGALSGARG